MPRKEKVEIVTGPRPHVQILEEEVMDRLMQLIPQKGDHKRALLRVAMNYLGEVIGQMRATGERK